MITQILKQIENKIDGEIIYLTQFGSYLYGTETETSDLDFRGVFIPSTKSLLLKIDQDEFNDEFYVNKTKIDVKLFSIYKFLKLCSKADTNALDVLFSVDAIHIAQYKNLTYMDKNSHSFLIIQYIKKNVNKLINSNRLESPCTYAFKQSTKYSIKGTRYKILLNLIEDATTYYNLDTTPKDVTLERFITDFTYQDLKPVINNYLDNKYVRIDILDNKGKKEKYLYVCGVQHQFNLELKTFIDRLRKKVTKEYTSQRTKDAMDGNDWKALSHAVRIVLQIKELLTTKNVSFPVNPIIKDIKLGKLTREQVDLMFSSNFNYILELIQQDPLFWRYDEEFWNNFILELKGEN